MFGLTPLLKNRRCFGACLHSQRKRRQFPGTFVDLDTVEVIREDLLRDLCGINAFLLVDGVEQIEGVGEHVAGAAGRVANLDLFRFADAQEVRLGLCGLDVVVHLQGQLRAGAIEQPQTAEGVFHQVAHDPMRGEKLGGGRDVLGRDFLVLLQPSNTSSFFSEM